NVPALIVIVVLVGYPIAYSAWVSLHKYSLKRPRVLEFVGLTNYLTILQSDEFWSALWITVVFTTLVVTLVSAIGLLIALLLNEEFPGSGLVTSRRKIERLMWIGQCTGTAKTHPRGRAGSI